MLLLQCFIPLVFLVSLTITIFDSCRTFFVKTNLKGHHCSQITYRYKRRKVPLKESQHSPKAH